MDKVSSVIWKRVNYVLEQGEWGVDTLKDYIAMLQGLLTACKNCGEEIIKVRRGQRFCSEKCSRQYRQRKYASKRCPDRIVDSSYRAIRKPANTQRDKEIVSLYFEGLLPVQKIGDHYGISRQRVYQIIQCNRR